MERLNLPTYAYKIKQSGANSLIFDELRRKYVLLTPEEWVRQHFIHYLLKDLHYPRGLVSVERGATYNQLHKRTDICIYNHAGQPELLVECKAAHVPITQEVVKQVSTYNQVVKARLLVITNGLQHYCWQVDFKTRTFVPLQEIPPYIQ
ncbi:type I restriction enzyme HsdR N-terminal domain-containing protein [Pontibacter sp. 13R65]|uniref:type I restriction enzyme HsdR N-terminal domain-containing protein n=1 Tax=Pontibacter sp. 13R65 TaxID=3127458 RepID=UPI00301CD7AD